MRHRLPVAIDRRRLDARQALLRADLNRNIRFTRCQSGRMIYLAISELARMKADVAAWHDKALR